MFALLSRHFEGVTPSQFQSDLAAKNWVLLMTGEHDRLVGFSTLDFQVVDYEGHSESVLYSGDTIMDPGAWNSTILSRAWIEAAYNLHAHFGRGPLWWLLITSGFRTYRLLPVFWQQFFPRCNAATPQEVQSRLRTFAGERFGPSFDSAKGIVRLSQPQRLRGHLRGIPAGRLRNRHVAFFNELNPGHVDGDELVCLTRLDEKNLTSAGRRIVDSVRLAPALDGNVS